MTATQARQQAQAAQQQAQARTHEATALRLASEGQAMLEGPRPGGEVRALQELLASGGQRVASTVDPGTLFKAVFTRRDMLKIIPASDRVWGVAFSPDGRRIVSSSDDNSAAVGRRNGLTDRAAVNGHALTV